jgi:hypothetical protein
MKQRDRRMGWFSLPFFFFYDKKVRFQACLFWFLKKGVFGALEGAQQMYEFSVCLGHFSIKINQSRLSNLSS